MSNVQKIIDKIQDGNIQPRPKWAFTYSEWLKWSAYCLFMLLGSISFSIILFAISINGFDMLQHFNHSKLESLLVLLPLLWLGVLLLFLIASIFSVVQTRRAYKLSFGQWIRISIAMSMVIGTLVFLTGGAKWLENTFETNIESYQSLLEKKTAIWSQPELGTLSGEILQVKDNIFTIRDWKNRIWTIQSSTAFIAPILELTPGEQIKLNGMLIDDHTFKAEKVRPWGGAPGKCAQ
jgi:hypothetical protein